MPETHDLSLPSNPDEGATAPDLPPPPPAPKTENPVLLAARLAAQARALLDSCLSFPDDPDQVRIWAQHARDKFAVAYGITKELAR